MRRALLKVGSYATVVVVAVCLAASIYDDIPGAPPWPIARAEKIIAHEEAVAADKSRNPNRRAVAETQKLIVQARLENFAKPNGAIEFAGVAIVLAVVGVFGVDRVLVFVRIRS